LKFEYMKKYMVGTSIIIVLVQGKRVGWFNKALLMEQDKVLQLCYKGKNRF
jgi:hypothetical protein